MVISGNIIFHRIDNIKGLGVFLQVFSKKKPRDVNVTKEGGGNGYKKNNRQNYCNIE